VTALGTGGRTRDADGVARLPTDPRKGTRSHETQMRRALRKAKAVPTGNAWVHCVLLVVSILWVFPLLYTFISGFKTTGQQYSSPLSIPRPFEWQNFPGAWSQGSLGSAFTNSIIVTVQTVVIVLVVSLLAAYALACFDMRFRGVLYVLFLLPAFVPAEATLVPLFLMFSKLHLTDSLEGLVLANCGTTIALAVLLFTQFLQGVPREVTEAAKLDGATRLRTLLSVLVPLSWPAVVSVTIFISVFAWNDFFAALVLIQSTSHFTIQLAINNFSTAYATNLGYRSAALGMAAVPPLIFFAVFQKSFSASVGLRPGRSR
jgi:ABC-type glycerol-3-phosphate transport system permease component